MIFTTAHDQYAVAAFELEALDYLLKPFSHHRFMSALERARQAHARDDVDALNRAHTLLTRTGPAVLDRIFVRETNAVVPVPVTEVERIVGLDGARFEVVMKNGALVPVSRARSQEIRRLSR